jgi:hypothetical protein
MANQVKGGLPWLGHEEMLATTRSGLAEALSQRREIPME